MIIDIIILIIGVSIIVFGIIQAFQSDTLTNEETNTNKKKVVYVDSPVTTEDIVLYNITNPDNVHDIGTIHL